MTSKIKSDKVRFSTCRFNQPSLQRSQAVVNEHRETHIFNSATRLDSGLGAGTVCSSEDMDDDTHMTESVSFTLSSNKPGEGSAYEVFGGRVDFINKGSIETLPSEEGVESSDEAAVCSVEDMLNFTFKVCDTEGTGKVPASAIVRYLQEMTGQSYKYGRLHILHNMLDPDRKDVAIDHERFHSTMKRWIATCSQEGTPDNKARTDMGEHPYIHSMDREETCLVVPGTLEEEMDSSKVYFQSDQTFTKRTGSFSRRETKELISDVADLKYANQKLREQNASLQKAMEISDDTNLQLTKELSKLKDQLTSSQRTVRSVKTMVEDLEEAKNTGRYAQEKVCQLQTHCKELVCKERIQFLDHSTTNKSTETGSLTH
ncbi:inositol 1,4,5-triphosphate receptor associated 2-like [Cetorhinus maximus]